MTPCFWNVFHDASIFDFFRDCLLAVLAVVHARPELADICREHLLLRLVGLALPVPALFHGNSGLLGCTPLDEDGEKHQQKETSCPISGEQPWRTRVFQVLQFLRWLLPGRDKDAGN